MNWETHAIDLLRWFGGEIVAVCVQMAKPRQHEVREGEDACYTSMAISFRYETEAVATLMASWDSDFHPSRSSDSKSAVPMAKSSLIMSSHAQP